MHQHFGPRIDLFNGFSRAVTMWVSQASIRASTRDRLTGSSRDKAGLSIRRGDKSVLPGLNRASSTPDQKRRTGVPGSVIVTR